MAKMTIDVSIKDTDVFHKLVDLLVRIEDSPETPESIKQLIKETTTNIYVDVNRVTVEGCKCQDIDVKQTVEAILDKLKWHERLA
jgi:uncharacterized protein (UPF0276 family)